MSDRRKKQEQGIVQRAMRIDYRQKQIKAITDEIRKKYMALLRAATSSKEKHALKAERDAEIAKEIEPLLRDQGLDTPECL